MSRHLRDFGFGKSSMQDSINHEVKKLVDSCQKHVGGEAFNLNKTVNISIINALWLILVGECFELDDPKIKELCQFVDNILRSSSPQSPLARILPSPAMIKLPGKKTDFRC